MKHCLPPIVISLAALFTCAPPAQAQDSLLVIERKQDRRGRDALLAQLNKIRIRVFLNEADPQVIADYLQAATGSKIPFILSLRKTKKEDLPKVTLKLRKLSLKNALAVLQEQSGLRFVYRSGIVFMRPKDEVKEFRYLRMYDVRAATFRARNFPGPKLGLGRGDEAVEEPDEDEGRPVSGFDADQLVDLIRTHVVPDSWDAEGNSISQSRGVLLVRQTETGHRKVQVLLAKFGVAPQVTYVRRARRLPRRIVTPRVRPVRKAESKPRPKPKSKKKK